MSASRLRARGREAVAWMCVRVPCVVRCDIFFYEFCFIHLHIFEYPVKWRFVLREGTDVACVWVGGLVCGCSVFCTHAHTHTFVCFSAGYRRADWICCNSKVTQKRSTRIHLDKYAYIIYMYNTFLYITFKTII